MTRILTIIVIMFVTPAWANVSSDGSEGINSNVEVNIKIFKWRQPDVDILLIEENVVVKKEKIKKFFSAQMKPKISTLWFGFTNSQPLTFELSEQTTGKAHLILVAGYGGELDGIYPVDKSTFIKLKNKKAFRKDERKALRKFQKASHVVPDYKIFGHKNFSEIQLGDNMLETMEERELRLANEREQKLLREKEERARQFARMREVCEEYGFQPKTDGLAGCVQRLHSAVLKAEAQQAAAEQRERLAAKQLEAMDANAKAARWNAILNSVIQAGVSTYNTNRQIQNDNFNTSRTIFNNNLNRR